MKTIRFVLTVLAPQDVPTLLDIVTRVPGVVAASVHGSDLDVVITDADAGLLIREEIRGALAADAFVAA